MKLRSPLLALALAAALATPAAAAEFWAGVDGGLGIPIGNLSDAASTGFNLGLHGTYRMTDQFGFGGELGWQSYGGNDDLEKELSALAGTAVDVRLRVIPILAFAEYELPGQTSMVPFLRAGLGLYNLNLKAESAAGDTEDSETKFGLHVGGGLNGEVSDTIQWSVDGLYHYVLDAAADDGGGETAGSVITLRGKLSFALMK